MPEGETITTYSDRLVALAQLNISEHGGSKTTVNGKSVYRIHSEKPANVEPLPDLKQQYAAMRSQLRSEIDKGIANGGTAQERARAAYLTICLDFAPELKQKYPRQWPQALQALAGYPRVMQAIFFEAPFPAGDAIRQKAQAAGLERPAQG